MSQSLHAMQTPFYISDFLWDKTISYIDGLVLEKRNSIANALELRLYCTNPLIYHLHCFTW